jgi:hypothetical protein
MRFYLDTEFNGFGGELISLALVSETGWLMYGIVKPSSGRVLDPWVAENVIPALNSKWAPKTKEISRDSLAIACASALAMPHPVEVYADWPADIEYLCGLLALHGKNQGFSYCPNIIFRLIATPDLTKWRIGTQHNALDDALTLRAWHESQATQ